MMTKEEIERIAENCGVKVSYTDPGKGGFIIDASGKVYTSISDIDIKMDNNLFNQFLKTNKDKISSIIPKNPSISKSDEWYREDFWDETDTPTAKARWVLIYIHFQIYSKVYETNEFL